MDRKDILQTLHHHLQHAIELEHATLPPYLCAFWSIHGDSIHAREAKEIFLSIIREEMLHLAMACNILNATGGHPSFIHENFIPAYPCFLPGHSHTVNPFVVHLDKCCPASVEIFLKIEMPENLVHEKEPEKRWATIGQFYEEIISLISHVELNEKDFQHGKQTDNKVNPAHGILYTVNSRADALLALNEIIDQGEGLKRRSHYDAQHELTHYWKFKKVFDKMISGEWKYEEEIFPLAADANEIYFSDKAKKINQEFAEVYFSLLISLHDSFNSEQPNLNNAIGIMFKLKPLAQQLMQIQLINQEGNCCPIFRVLSGVST